MSTDTAARSWPDTVIEVAYYAAAAIFFGLLFVYFLTGLGGPSQLAAMMVPLTFVLFALGALRENDLYPSLGRPLNYLICAIYCGLAIATAIYMTLEFDAIGFARAGFWNTPDMIFGALMVLLILEYSRKRFFPLFIINLVLIIYCVYGWAVPGMFHHPGFDWERVLTAMSLEMATGIYSRLPQLALTLIGAFILVLSTLRAFGCIDSILKGAGQVGSRSPHAVPLSAVLGSIGIGAISGSGAANAITTGSATIPAMIASGMPRHQAASIEASASLGGQLMPPVMGISAFLMADFMGVSYFDVVARGYAPAIIYFVGVLTGTYLLSVHHSTKAQTLTEEGMTWGDWANLSAFVIVVGGLIFLMAALYMAPMFAALYVFFVVGALLLIKHLAVLAISGAGFTFKSITDPIFRFLDSFSSVTADLTLLLATLSIMTGAFVITGVPTKIGFILIEAAGINLFAMAIVAFFFGAFLGTGLPPAPTYILTALVIAPAMIKTGVDPWCVHFFAFFLAVWGELTPPTSLVAAVTAKIAETSFMRTLMAAITLCSSLFVLMTAAFTRPELVLEPGMPQLVALGLVSAATIALMFSLQATFSERTGVDLAIRLLLAALAIAILFLPSEALAAVACIPAALIIGYWIVRRRQRAPEVSAAPAT
ncbi:MAG TPA: TRAP transporter fused permease subunit [Hyphomicrobiaceae bacterium]|nr:TRAP transporter fused permease subunit [Hyphomicrobiaceae bacterium]